MKLSDKLHSIGACKGAIKWSEEFTSLDEAWTSCHRGDWMLWLLRSNAAYAAADAAAYASADSAAADAAYAIRKLFPIASKVIKII